MKYLVGIDEVGRGPIAGPVAVCSFRILKADSDIWIGTAKEILRLPLRDSKKLTQIQREKWFAYLKKAKDNGLCDYSVVFVAASVIDKVGIVPAITKALEQSLLKTTTDPSEMEIVLDGGLIAPKRYSHQKTVIKGDELYPVISCASIIAKVSRDRVMKKHGIEYPGYGFETHVGYGTKAHYEAILTQGVTPLHRKSFLKDLSEDA